MPAIGEIASNHVQNKIAQRFNSALVLLDVAATFDSVTRVDPFFKVKTSRIHHAETPL